VKETPAEITRLLRAMGAGDKEAEDQIFRVIYPQLRRLAAHYMHWEKPNHTLQPTALAHEAYLKLMGQQGAEWSHESTS
jgi:hypothetical protein